MSRVVTLALSVVALLLTSTFAGAKNPERLRRQRRCLSAQLLHSSQMRRQHWAR